jgi:hypothetical protein
MRLLPARRRLLNRGLVPRDQLRLRLIRSLHGPRVLRVVLRVRVLAANR